MLILMLTRGAKGMRRLINWVFLCSVFARIGKRGEPRCERVLFAPKPSSFYKAGLRLGSPVLPVFLFLVCYF